jgi:histidinol-phosphate aminotransferase
MSKAWGLAGLRMGYLVAQPPVAAAIRKVLTPFSTSLVAQAAALAALQQEDEVKRRCSLVVSERDRVTEALRKLGVEVPTSQANFVWLPLGAEAAAFGTACENQGVIVRAFPPDGVRVTIGTPTENDQFLAAAEIALEKTA